MKKKANRKKDSSRVQQSSAHLYHYTKTLDILRRILKEGFWPQYTVEDFSWIQDGTLRYLAFPMRLLYAT